MSSFGFTPQEYRVIEELLKVAKNVYITVCTDSFEDDSSKSDASDAGDVFYTNKITAARLIKIA